MTSREIVRKAIRFEKPERIPYHLPEPYPTDILWLFIKADIDFVPTKPGQDEWGSIWSTLDSASMGEVVQCALPEWEMYDTFKFPNINKIERYEESKKRIQNNTSNKYVLGTTNGIFARTMHLRGLTNVMIDLYEHEDKLGVLTDRMVEIAIESIDIWASLGADGVITGFDDWGLQDRLMINPDKWRSFYKPRYMKIWQHARSKNMDVFLHCCGNILSILDDMIDAGLNVINMDQQENMGLSTLCEKFKGKVCFWNPVDIQTVMINGTADDVRAYTKEQILALSDEMGGYIGKYYSQPEAVRHTQTNIDAMSKAILEFSNIHRKH